MDAFETRLLRSLVDQYEAECVRNKAGAPSNHEHVAESALAIVLRAQGGAILMGHDLYRCEGARVVVHRAVPDLDRAAQARAN